MRFYTFLNLKLNNMNFCARVSIVFNSNLLFWFPMLWRTHRGFFLNPPYVQVLLQSFTSAFCPFADGVTFGISAQDGTRGKAYGIHRSTSSLSFNDKVRPNVSKESSDWLV